MTEPTPYALSHLFSDLVGRGVTFTLAPKPPVTKARTIYGVYGMVPSDRAIVVKADLPMLGSLAGALLGLPDDTATERALQTPMDESVRDAMHEILNIASTALSTDGRVVLKHMAADPVYCTGDAADVLNRPDQKSNYQVTIDGGSGGVFTILSRL